jgi:aspartyl-tRNA(Asn)/glutamyl-tRNA(Gln) amidotransferase subunit A
LRASDYVEALTAFREIQAQFGRCFRTFDLLMTPTAGSLPWPAEQEGPPRSRVFTGIVNAAGYPAITIPGEPSSNGLPIGFQLVGRFGADWDLVELAAGYESRYPWSDRRPDL